MKIKYSTPEMEIISLVYEDVVTASGDWVDDNSQPPYESEEDGWQ